MESNSLNRQNSTREVPVMDLHLMRGDGVGNPYRILDKGTKEWGPLTTKSHWREHPNPHILPINGDYDAERVVPVSQFDGDLPVTPDVEKDDDEQPVNEFDCPRCGTHLTGYPEACPECGATYDW